MQLLKMELRGFKSFADKTTLTFDKGITAIVGPNGSGKSNISDAVRWVMGEQNVRQLRGQKSEDIIFAGTQTRRPQGAAEVSLYFDNSDHALDTEFTEVVVTRRLFRSGDSEYYINRRPCRLKDIHLLFADTGIGQDSMAVIGQNRVDCILNSKPEERRVIFEEVAGISRFKGRKADGLRKIAETERNLERLHDLMGVLEERLGPLQVQAETLQKFRCLDGERLAYEGTLTLQELRNSERLLEKAENNRLTAAAEEEKAAAELAEAEGKRKALLAAMASEEEKLRRLDEETLAVHNERDSLVHRREACRQRQAELAEREREAAAEAAQLQQRRENWQKQKVFLQSQKDQKGTELAAARKALALTQTLFGQAEAKAEAAAKALQERVDANSKRSREAFILRRDAEDLRRRLEENAAACKEALDHWEKQKENLSAAKEHQADAASRYESWQKKADSAKAEGAARRQEADAARRRLKQGEDEYRRLRSDVDAAAQRLRVLQSMESEHEGLGRAVKVVLTVRQPWRSRLCGAVGELCRIPSKYAVAIDVALGGAVRYVVADDEKAAKAAISYLKEKKAGRTTFLPLDTLRSRRRTSDEEKAASEPGMLGFASDVLTYDAKYEKVFTSLLGRTLLADTMDTGSAVARKYGHRLRIVCLDGTQFNAGGSLTGGSSRSQEGSLISRRALQQELQEKCQKGKNRLETLLDEGQELRRQAESAEAKLSSAETSWRQASQEAAQAKWQAEQEEKNLSALQQDVAGFDSRVEALENSRAAMQADLVAKEKALSAMESGPSADVQAWQAASDAARQEAAQCRQTLTERQIAVAKLTEQVSHSEEQLRQHETWQQELTSQDAALKQRRQDLARRSQEAAQLLTELTKNIALKEAETARCDQAKEAFYKTRNESLQKSHDLDEAVDDLRRRSQDWQQRRSAADVQLEKYKSDISHHEEHLAMQGLSRQEAMERRREGSLKELHAKIAAIKEDIAALGTVNPAAEDEYKTALAKKDFYIRQCDDLKESREKLRGVVAEIDAAMAEQFAQAFKAIGGHFQDIFSHLFDGGTAHLALTDKDHILESGVEIYIRPPGKKQQSLTLLSGGERALTVIALLLAFLAYHPAPFCLVDEVDAALDEANVERMARYLKNYSGATQFIVITHRRKTMEAANTLLGVTMEEKGVSRLLTVKVDELLKEGT
ncbi:chromosome segregation protein SMC [uncultured Megasphaera sp.]|uniref:chromosome segregation protein SMC n=1 Tax=uncultured Megasphaera sp. TaxID=165188 RepID=UPI0025F34692|nr:chromosome segregation protein SMC [uncultured Megasphaera sp.]